MITYRLEKWWCAKKHNFRAIRERITFRKSNETEAYHIV